MGTPRLQLSGRSAEELSIYETETGRLKEAPQREKSVGIRDAIRNSYRQILRILGPMYTPC